MNQELNFEEIQQPMPKNNFSVSYVCRYESEIDRQVLLDSMGHYIEKILGTLEILFVKAPMDAINKSFRLDMRWPGEEIEFLPDYKQGNIKMMSSLSHEELPPLWSVLTNSEEENEIHIITTIEPCKFIIKTSDLPRFKQIMANVYIAPKEYNYDALKTVHWDDKTNDIKRDIEFFASARRWFSEKGLPYNRSYLLYGPPGNGKTTTIKAISRFLNVKPDVFDFSAASNSPDSTFTSWIIGDSERMMDELNDNSAAARKYVDVDDDDDDNENRAVIRMLILEDIDRFFPKTGEKQTAVSLSAILNALDGSTERRNTVIIATANHPENLDRNVLARPGRFDKQIEYAPPSILQALSYLKKLFDGEDVTESALLQACEKFVDQSYAQHKELFPAAASYAFDRKSKSITDEDLFNAINGMLKHIDVNVMSSRQRKVGFGDR